MKLRFAPSPTGFLHVGGARTAIFNLLHARRYGGSLLLRIEDTDVERSRQHHAEQIVNSLRWLGVDWDEGPVYQSDRLDRYRERAEELVTAGSAYRCYCSVEELEAERNAAEGEGRAYRYSGKCRTLAPEQEPTDRGSVIRFKVGPGSIDFHDLIRGDVHFEAELIDDFVLLRSDNNPTYHLSVVVDDIDMQITHVARGDDHLSNTPKHILLFNAFGAEPPAFAHLPLILGSDKKRLSKRTGATSVEEYQSLGILPDALLNFLALLGWSPGGDREILTRREMIEAFDLAHVHKSPAVFDVEKLIWLNGQYLLAASVEEIWPYLEPFITTEAPRERLLPVVELQKPRSRTLRELGQAVDLYFADDDSIEYEEEAVKKHIKGDDLEERLQRLLSYLERSDPFDVANTEAGLRQMAEATGVSAAKYIHPLRVAVIGKTASPPIFDVLVAMGREKSIARVKRLIERLPELRTAV
jgi:glutamyl-tRNA synthetase